MEHGTGAVLDRPDNRDYQWSEVGYGSAPFDWDAGYDIEKTLEVSIKAKDQDGSGSCGGQACSYYMASIEALFTGTYEERSARYIYSQTFVPPAGSRGRDNAQLLKDQGCALETHLTSYDKGKPPTEPFMQKNSDITAEIRELAKRGRILSYANVDVNIDTIAQAVRDNGGVVIGIVGQDNGTWRTKFPKKPTMDNPRWYHWVYVGKAILIKGKKYLGFINSWGKDCGENGWQYVDEDYINTILPGDNYGRAVWQVWTMVFNPQSVPPDFHHVFNKDLEYGMVDEEVKALQTALQLEECMAQMKPTTFYGPITRDAVKKFQRKYGVANFLTPGYGRCGPKTRAKLNSLFGVSQ